MICNITAEMPTGVRGLLYIVAQSFPQRLQEKNRGKIMEKQHDHYCFKFKGTSQMGMDKILDDQIMTHYYF